MATLSIAGKVARADLLPCPYCGGEHIKATGASYLWFVCMTCRSEGPLGDGLPPENTDRGEYTDEDIQNAVKLWNKRICHLPNNPADLLRVFNEKMRAVSDNPANIPTQAEAEAGVEVDPQYSQEANAIFDKFLKNKERKD